MVAAAIPQFRPGGQPAHHLSEELLLAYATGGLSEAVALVAAAHLTLCPSCRAELARAQAIGGALVEATPPVAMQAGALDRLLARLDQPAPPAEERLTAGSRDRDIPGPLRAYLPADAENLPWRKVIAGLYEYKLDLPGHQGMASLLRIIPGKAMPQHTHRGHEMTLVLRGDFDDKTGHYGAGDLALTDDTVDHQPVAGAHADCIALAVTDAPLKLTGTFGRLLNPFIRF
ncbi:ChrR family anti-sigma-E factor [Desertibaculum subflavum]|uniref:ChrR family anti-sigma-E factor n=1 Tax=Desertibaculum subflavum TaxID=2268458 RepID=UPI000E673B33